MSYRSYTLGLCLVVVTMGCNGDSDGAAAASGTSLDQASEALIKAIEFSGGKVVQGLMPETTNSEVTLLGGGLALAIGNVGIMPFEVGPVDVEVLEGLVQIGDTKSYFLIEGDAFVDVKPAAPDAGSGSTSTFGVSYSVAKNVCRSLCDITYDLDLVRAVTLPDDGVSEHLESTLVLDCRARGDRDRCSKKQAAAAEKDASTSTDVPDGGGSNSIRDAGGDAANGGDAMPNAQVDAGGSMAMVPDQCSETLPGEYAVKVELDAYWMDELNTPVAAVFDAGRGKIQVFYRATFEDFDAQAMNGTATIKPCGIVFPPILITPLCQAAQYEAPNALWNGAGIQPVSTAVDAEGFAMNDTITFGIGIQLLGLSLTDINTFPADVTATACAAGGGATCFPDQDGDGHAGITLTLLGSGTVANPPYPCTGLMPDYSYFGTPLNVSGGTDATTAREVYIGMSTRYGAQAQRQAGCTDAVGTATTSTSFSMRAVGCTRRDDAACAGPDQTFLDQNLPSFHVLANGAMPPGGWQHGDPAKDAVLDRSASEGGKSSLMRLGDVGTGSSCAAVRGATFLPFE